MKPYFTYALQALLFITVIVMVLSPIAAQTKPTQIPIGSIQPVGAPGCFVGLDGTGHFQCVPIPAPPVAPARLYNQLARSLDVAAFTWTLPSAPNPATLEVYRNGLMMAPGIDYTVTGAVITFTAAQTSAITDVIISAYVPQ